MPPGGRGPGGPGGPGGPYGPGGPRGSRGPGGPRGPRRNARGKIKGSWWRHWTWRKALALSAGAVGGCVLIGIAGVAIAYEETPVPTQELLANTYQNSTVYYSDGHTVMGTFGNYDRQILSYNQIPKILQDAAVSAEDRSFWTEGGVSPKGIARAAYDDVFNSSSSLQGGSTITQQFVRNYYDGIGTAQTASRKIKEIFVSVKIAKDKSKQWILTNYLNTIYLGDGAYGVSAASELYFGVPVSKLTVAQSAVIAAIIQQPTNYPQPQYRPQLEARWQYVLTGMVKDNDLTSAQAAAMKFPAMNTSGAVQSASDPWDAYIMQQVQSELLNNYKYSQSQIDDAGLKIVTSINYQDEKKLYAAVNQNLLLMKEDGGALPSYALLGAELQDPSDGAILAEYPGAGETTTDCHYCDENTILTREQVGSSFKPYVLATAVKEGMNVQTSTLNGYSPLWVPPVYDSSTLSSQTKAKAMPYAQEVNNDGDESLGPMNVQDAFAQSSNTAFTDLIHRTTTQSVINFASSVGVNPANYPTGSNLQADNGHVTMALGQDALDVNEQDTMMSALANGGTYHEGHVVQSITGLGTTTQAKYASQEVLTSAQDSQVQYAMSTVVTDGTATGAAMSDGRPIIGKTGTTSNYHSAFFLGAIPQASLTVGIFTAQQNTNSGPNLQDLGGNNGQNGFGGYWPAKIWHDFMESAYATSPIENFMTPQFSGQAWDQVPTVKKTTQKQNNNGNGNGNGGHHHGNPIGQPTVGTSTGTATSTASPTATPSASTTCFAGFGNCGTGNGGTTSGNTSAGAAVGGGLLAVLPGSLLWNKISRRRKKRRNQQ